MLTSITVASEEQLTCLYVVCGAAQERLLNEAVSSATRLSHVRIVRVNALIDLAGLVESAR